jgi:hypothetical protein
VGCRRLGVGHGVTDGYSSGGDTEPSIYRWRFWWTLSKPETACVAASGMVGFFDEYITIKLLMVDTLTIACRK